MFVFQRRSRKGWDLVSRLLYKLLGATPDKALPPPLRMRSEPAATDEEPMPLVIARPAPEPSEVIWQNLELDDKHEVRRRP